MNPDLLPANFSLIFMAAAGAALLANIIALSTGHLLRAIDAAAAAGLVYLLGAGAFGWSFLPREALFALYAAIFAVLAATAILRKARADDAGEPLGPALIQQAAMAYLFIAPDHWKPQLSALLAIYFLINAIGWLRGSEPAEETKRADPRPPLFPPKRVRGVREFAGVALAAAFVFVFAMGTRPPVAPPPAPVAEETPAAPEETTASEEAEAPAPAKEETPAYVAKAGETLKSIARKLYGKPDRWRVLAELNPGLRPTAKLKAGQAIKLPPPQKSEP